ncbi:hypothetical protein HDU76_012239 [Blyttiomyces sp. JEL0837]|nr:hypothetical protein HDU76_012239 [Blyttiomyces sp. JEL0837]
MIELEETANANITSQTDPASASDAAMAGEAKSEKQNVIENTFSAPDRINLGNSNSNAQAQMNAGFGLNRPQDASKEARIASRKSRIEANRAAKLKPEKVDDSVARRKPKLEPEQKETGKAKAQITQSSKRIESTKLTSTEFVTNVKVGIVSRESLRRMEEVRKKEFWEKRRSDEQTMSGDMNDDIASQWEKILKLEGPYELNEMLLKQKEACDTFIANKNKLINECIAELKGKDDEYVKELKRQAEEIDTLLERMEEQYRSFQTTLREEIEQIEKSFVEERTELIETNIKEVESLFTHRRDNESKFMEERADRIEDHIKQLESLRVRDAEEYNLVKIKLETDVQVLEQQLQQMRATYQLNTEKLEYNFQVLKKREEENATILGTQKRKITRLTDHLNMLKAKMAKQEKGFQQEYMSLTDDYKRITEQFKELQKKFRHFQIADDKKYREVWNMNKELTQELMRKVLQADRIIHEQQLGMKWTPPSEDLFRSNAEPDAALATGGDSLSGQKDSNMVQATIAASGVEGEATAGTLQAATAAAAAGAGILRENLMSKFKDHKGYSRTMKGMLELLCNEAGFLVEDKLQKLLAPLHRDEQSLMKLDSIFKALGVDSVEDIEKLTSYFVERDHATPSAATRDNNGVGGAMNPEEESKANGSETQSPDAAIAAPHTPRANVRTAGDDSIQTNLIHPDEVVRAIRRFLEDNKVEKTVAPGAHDPFSSIFDPSGASGKDSGKEKPDSEKDQVETEVKSKSERQREYWERMGNVIDDKSYRIWTAVYVAMEKYNALLTERFQLTQDISSIYHQNEELKTLLRQYMSAKVNDELQVPPTQIMLAQAGIVPNAGDNGK